MKLLSSGTDEVCRSASWAITVAASDEPTAIEIGRFGYVDILYMYYNLIYLLLLAGNSLRENHQCV